MSEQKYYFHCDYCGTRALYEVAKDAVKPCVICKGPTRRKPTPQEELARAAAWSAEAQQVPLWRRILEECGLLKPKEEP